MGIIIIIASVVIALLFLLIGLPLGLDPDLCLLISMGLMIGGIIWGLHICDEENSYTSPTATTPHTASTTSNGYLKNSYSRTFSDNEVLIFAKENCKESILTFHSSYPRYNLTAYLINYGFCTIDRISSSKWYVTLRGSVFEPDIYATGIRKSETFSQTFTISEENGYLFKSGIEGVYTSMLKAEKEKFDLYKK